jgi:peptidoglycan/LPS O-acetylase OafA/YrhL
MKKSNIQIYDVLRCIAIICIIFAHMDSYTNLTFFGKYDEYFAYIGLIIFFFISGFLFQYNNKIESKKDIILSIKKRAKRIYPLFWLSILITIILNRLHLNILPSDMKTFDLLVTMLGLQGLFPMFKVPYALWYIGIIIIFYMVSYFLLYYAKNIKQIVVYSVSVFFLFFLFRYKFGIISVDLLMYYFVFVAGFITGFICNSKNISNETIKSISLTSLFFVVSLFGIYIRSCSMMSEGGITKVFINEHGILNILNTDIFNFVLISDIFMFVIVIIVGILIYKSSFYIPNLDILKNIPSKLAYSSYAIYLFHIQILSLIKIVLDLIVVKEVTDYLMLILGIPILFVVGYKIQKYFDLYLR